MYFKDKFDKEIQVAVRNMKEIGASTVIGTPNYNLFRFETIKNNDGIVKVIPLVMYETITSSNPNDNIYHNMICVSENNSATVINCGFATKTLTEMTLKLTRVEIGGEYVLHYVGTLTDKKGNLLFQKPLVLHIDGTTQSLVTDNFGQFGGYYTIKTDNPIKVVVVYNGDKEYDSCKASRTYTPPVTIVSEEKTEDKFTAIFIESIPSTIEYGDTVRINGTLVDANGNGIPDAEIKLIKNE